MGYRLERISGRRGRREFVDLPRSFMADMPAFVPPLTFEEVKRIDPAKNPFFAHAESCFWVLRDGRRACGRISATRDRLALEWNDDGTGVFGHFLAPDEDGAALLLDAARDWLRERGLTRMRGPIELSTNHTCGLQVTGFDLAPRLMMNQHPPGQEALLLSCGVEPCKDLIAFRLHRHKCRIDRLERGARISQRRLPADIRDIDRRRFQREIEILHDVYVRSWERNFAFVPASKEEFVHSARDLERILVCEMCQIAEVGGKPVGFILGLPNINVGVRACNGRLFPFGWWTMLRTMLRHNEFRVLTLGIVPEVRRTGLDHRLVYEHIVRSNDVGYDEAELSWVLEDNVPMVKLIVELGGREAIRYRLYESALAV